MDYRKEIYRLKKDKNVLILAHYYQIGEIQDIADFVGSTTGLLKFTKNDPAKKFIVATETGILHQMHIQSPEKRVSYGSFR